MEDTAPKVKSTKQIKVLTATHVPSYLATWVFDLLVIASMRLLLGSLLAGRVQAKFLTKRKNQEISREERRRKATQLRSKRREDIISKKRALGGSDTAPFLTAVICLGETASNQTLLESLKSCDAEAKIKSSPRGILHIK